MKRLTLFIFLLLLFGFDAERIPAVRAQGGSVYAFEHVNVLPMDEERILADQTVLVSGDRITAVGPASSVRVPAGATRIDGRGKYLMPGLAEMHGHIPPPNESQAFIESVLFLYVANGLTTVRGMQGHPGQLELKARVNTGELIGPNLYLAGPGFSGGSVDSPEQAEAMVRQQKSEGWDLLKILPGLTRAEYDAMANTANEVGIRFGGHVPSDVGLAHAMEMGQETFDHLDGYIDYLDGQSELITDEAIDAAYNKTIESGAWVVPTMYVWETARAITDLDWARNLPELQYMPRGIVDGWIRSLESRQSGPQFNRQAEENRIENRMRLLGAMSDANARILMGTDAPQWFSVPGFSIHHELPRMVDAGMTPYEIYRTGSVAIGDYFSNADDFGTVTVGQRADLIILDANPLEDVAHIRQRTGVMVRGHWLSEEAIQNRLKEIAAMNASGN